MRWDFEDWLVFLAGIAVVAFFVWGIFFWEGNYSGSRRPPCAGIADPDLYAACIEAHLQEPGEPLAPLAP